jgi:hypothetical protein
MVGGTVSVTVILNVHVDMFPEPSVPVHVTVLTPIGKVFPEAGMQLTETTPGQLSVPVAFVYETAASQSTGSAFTEILAGHESTGASVSLTVTLNEHVAVFPAPSVAVHVTTVVPTANELPDAGEHSMAEPGQLSVAVAA